MKQKLKIITCFITWLLIATNAKAQTPDTSAVDKLIRYILQPVDKSQVPTNILAEYGAPILNLPTFNGTLTDSNKVDITAFRTLAFQLQTSYCGTGTSPLPTITTVNNSIANFSAAVGILANSLLALVNISPRRCCAFGQQQN